VFSYVGVQLRALSDERLARAPCAAVTARIAFPQVLTLQYYTGTSLTCCGRSLVSRAGEITIRGGPTHGQYAPAA
jgi:hypothetical protein